MPDDKLQHIQKAISQNRATLLQARNLITEMEEAEERTARQINQTKEGAAPPRPGSEKAPDR